MVYLPLGAVEARPNARHTRAPVTTPRDCEIDTLRAVACIALVSFHVVGVSPASGMELPRDHALHLLNATFVDMRMPLFSFLSGLVFVSMAHSPRPPQAMIAAKMRRLLLPMLTVGALFWLARDLAGQAQQPLASIVVLPFAHFWFLQATFLIMAVFILFCAVRPGYAVQIALGLMGLSAALWLAGPRPPINLFSVINAFYLMPFFMLGYVCAHGGVRDHMRRNRAALRPLAGMVLAGLVLIGAAVSTGAINAPPPMRRALGLAVGISFCLALLAFAPRHAAFARLAHYSYTIYLFHVFFTAGMIMALNRIAPGLPATAVWLASLGAGLLGPVLLHGILLRGRVLSLIFLGVRRRPGPARPVARSGAAQNGYIRQS